MAAKNNWKEQAGNRYTPEELKEMSESGGVKIHRRKRRVVRV